MTILNFLKKQKYGTKVAAVAADVSSLCPLALPPDLDPNARGVSNMEHQMEIYEEQTNFVVKRVILPVPRPKILDPGFRYVDSNNTDITKTFDRLCPGWRKKK